MPVLAVDGHERLRTDDVQEREQLVTTAVPGDVDVGIAAVEHLGAAAGQSVDHPGNRLLIAGDRRRRDEHGVALLQLDGPVLARRHQRQRRERLSLAAGRDDTHLGRIHITDLVDGDDLVGGNIECLQGAGDIHVPDHRAAEEGDLPARVDGGVDDLLDPVQVAGETGSNDPAARLGDDVVEAVPERRLRRYEPGPLGVGAVGEKQPDSLPAELGKRGQVGRTPVDRSRVELEVARVDDDPFWRIEGHPGAVRNRVRDGDQLELEWAFLGPLVVAERPERGIDPVLLDPAAGQLD